MTGCWVRFILTGVRFFRIFSEGHVEIARWNSPFISISLLDSERFLHLITFVKITEVLDLQIPSSLHSSSTPIHSPYSASVVSSVPSFLRNFAFHVW